MLNSTTGGQRVWPARFATFVVGVMLVTPPSTGAQQPISRLEPGTTVSVRTSEPINASAADGRVYTGVIDQDVLDNTARALIPRGSTVELVVRNDANDHRVLDLDSVVVNGQRYALNAAANPR